MIKLNKKGQSIMEYAILVSLVITALTGMQLYVRRGLQAKIKDASDNLPNYIRKQTDVASGDIFNEGHTQYEPYYRGGSETESTTTRGTEKFIAKDEAGQRELTDQSRSTKGFTTIGSWTNWDTGDMPEQAEE